jgi:amino acid permease
MENNQKKSFFRKNSIGTSIFIIFVIVYFLLKLNQTGDIILTISVTAVDSLLFLFVASVVQFIYNFIRKKTKKNKE